MSPEIYPTQWWMWCQHMQERHHPHQETGVWSCNHPAQGSKICIDTSTVCCYSSMPATKSSQPWQNKRCFYKQPDIQNAGCCPELTGGVILGRGCVFSSVKSPGAMGHSALEQMSLRSACTGTPWKETVITTAPPVIFSSTTNILNESEKENTLASKTVSKMCIILCCAYATYIDKTFMHTFHMCIHQLCFLWVPTFPQHRSLALIKEDNALK